MKLIQCRFSSGQRVPLLGSDRGCGAAAHAYPIHLR